MNVKVSVFVTSFEAIMYLLLNNLHDCTFKVLKQMEYSSTTKQLTFV